MYQLRPPALALAPYIEHYWFVSSADGPVDLKVDVFVDGRADLILNFSAPYERTVLGSQATRTITDSNLDAQRLQPIRIVQKGRVHTTGVRFRLGGLAPFVRVPLNTLTDTTPPPVQAFGDAFLATEATIRATDPDAQAQILDQFFLNHLQTPRSHTAFRQALDTLATSDGAAPLHDVAAAAGVTPRHVDRLFARYLGFPPKTLARILRFQSTLRALMRTERATRGASDGERLGAAQSEPRMRRDPGGSLAELALSAGYFDQAHFIREFRALSGGVPRGFRGYYPPAGPHDFAPNVVAFIQDGAPDPGL